MKRSIIALIVCLLTLGVINVTAAQSPTAPPTTTKPGTPPMLGRDRGPFEGLGALGAENVLELVAQVTGLPQAEIVTKLEGGQSLTQIVVAAGKSQDDVLKLAEQQISAKLDQAIKDGILNQARADKIKSQLLERVKAVLNDATLGKKLQERKAAEQQHQMHELLSEATALETGLLPREIMQRAMKGETLAQIAVAEGSSSDAVIKTATDLLKHWLTSAVRTQRLTQTQADQYLADFTKAAPDLVNKALELPKVGPGAPGMPGGPGMGPGHPGKPGRGGGKNRTPTPSVTPTGGA